MIEISTVRKNKINLADYPYQKDIDNRLLMAEFSAFDVEILEEILFNPLKIPITKLARSLETPPDQLIPVLQKLGSTGLMTVQADILVVDKEMRKYFETQLVKFEEDFKPDMESLQGLLKKVPIHILPIWYSIPRTSNNIFESIMEKYLLTPQIYQRYLMEQSFEDPIFSGIIQDVMQSDTYSVLGSQIQEKYNLSPEQFEEYILLMEFNFICCLSYRKIEDQWKEEVTLFHEWKEYLTFQKITKPKSIAKSSHVKRKRPKNFSFVEDMILLLKEKKFDDKDPYWKQVADKLCLIKLATQNNGVIKPTEVANDWLEMTLENKALYLYRHPANRLLSQPELANEKNIRESEKSIRSVLHSDWVFFDDFFKGVLVILNEDSKVMLKKAGKGYSYSLPQYSEEEKAFIKAVIFEWLFEAGIVAPGEFQGQDCFTVTSFGQSLFDS